MVRIVSKNNFFEIKISQRHDWETPALSFYDLLDRVKNSFSRCKHEEGSFFKAVYTDVLFDFFRLPVSSQTILNF